MDKYSSQTRRKVRFDIPDAVPLPPVQQNEHGTRSYINGTLINISAKTRPRSNIVFTSTAPVRVQFPPAVIMPPSCLKQRIIPAPVVTFRNRVVSSIPQNRTTYDLNTQLPPHKTLEALKNRHTIVILNASTTTTKLSHMHHRLPETVSNQFTRLKLFEDILASKPKSIPIPREPFRERSSSNSNHTTATVGNFAKNLFNPEANNRLVADLVERWHRMRYREETKVRALTEKLTFKRQSSGGTVSIRNRLRSDVKRFGCLKMSLEREPTVTTLLRAAREADENLLKIVLRKILIDGISKEALNSSDKSGRTALSYICSTNLTNFLDIMLQVPDIDVNKPDNEGNTPLHFAAQAGQADALNMLITRSRSLQIDAKNCLGFTPLMKAALQGRTRCAKLLLFAGASPVETDYGRGLRAEQWATFCGRYSCAEMLEKCARARLLEKSNSCRPNGDQPKMIVTRSKTNPIHTQIGESFRSKFRKFLPFGFTVKDKQTKNKDLVGSNPDIVGYLKSATLCASGPAISASKDKSQLMTALIRPLEVPKLEVTEANNQELIKKYETKLNREQSDLKMVTTSPRSRY